MAREFRTKESYAAEAVSRDMIVGFLRSIGYRDVADERKVSGNALSQTIRATSPGGQRVGMRVRLCWRYREWKGTNYSAAQLMARIQNDDWEGSIRSKVARQQVEGITHLLLAQPAGDQIEMAALIPLDAVWPIWRAQRDVSARLTKAGLLGARKKNHAMNGRSPTIYLRDERHDRADEVARALWTYPGVIDLTTQLAHGQDAPSSDQMFSDPETNRLIERAAVDFVREHYESTGWSVRSVEKEGCGFDLDCSRRGDTLHVEVKGVMGIAKQFNLTAGEHKRALTDNQFRLALVTSALSAPQLHVYDGPGLLRLFEATPIQYRVIEKTGH